jgi:hypothetical protein
LAKALSVNPFNAIVAPAAMPAFRKSLLLISIIASFMSGLITVNISHVACPII